MKLTSKNVAKLELGISENDVIHWDENLIGFGYRLRRSGERVRASFIAQYRAKRRTRRLLIGSAGTLTAEQAREAAKTALAKVALGGDPKGERDEERRRELHAFSVVASDYLAHRKSELRPRSYVEFNRYLLGPHFKPLHGIAIGDITRADIAKCVLQIDKDRGRVTAVHALTALGTMFRWALSIGLCETNPTIGVARLKKPPSRERVLNDQELAAILKAIGDSNEFSKVVRLLLLTAARKTEIGGLRWSELDAEKGTWELPAARAKNKRKHVLPLPPLAWDIIKSVPKVIGRDCLFGTRSEAGYTAWDIEKRVLDERLGEAVAAWRIHDLRRTAATKMGDDLSVQPHVIETILNHVSGHKGGIAGVYNKSRYEREVATALAMWADHVRALVEGGERRVIAFERCAV